jgi:hypothetical protein
MAKISFSKESLAGKPPVPEGLYELRLEGFEPEFSKNKNSVNLNAILKVVNHPTHNGERVFDNTNTGAGWILQAMCHAFGFPLVDDGNGNMNLPGDFVGPDDDPEKWDYVGPLKGAVAKAFVKQTVYNGRTSSKIDQWVCALGTGCTEKHPTGLAR